MTRLGAAVLPQRLGRDFRWLWPSFATSNLADGVLLAAAPLLVASLTREPFAIAMGVFAQRLPWLLLGVVAGVVVDRVDRRRLITVVNAARAATLAALTTAIVTDRVSLAVIYVVLFALGCAETFADNGGSALVATRVPSPALGEANARLLGTRMVTNEFGGPPIGAFLFAAGSAWPFGVATAMLVLASLVVLGVERRPVPRPVRDHRTTVRADVAEGMRWLWDHTAVRTLAMLITVFNVTFGAAFSIWVLYALERLGLTERGFGLLMTGSAIGGVVGSVVYPRLERRFSYATMLRVGLTVETLTHLGLALTTNPFVAASIMLLFGMHAVTWGSLSTTIRQRAVPETLLGRVTSVYLLGSVGAFALGTLVGGALAQRFGILAPFWFAFAGAAVTTALVWRSIDKVADAGASPDAQSR